MLLEFREFYALLVEKRGSRNDGTDKEDWHDVTHPGRGISISIRLLKNGKIKFFNGKRWEFGNIKKIQYISLWEFVYRRGWIARICMFWIGNDGDIAKSG